MNLREQRILFNAGFNLFRLDIELKQIRKAKRPGAWAKYKSYETKAACQRAWAELMKDETNLEA